LASAGSWRSENFLLLSAIPMTDLPPGSYLDDAPDVCALADWVTHPSRGDLFGSTDFAAPGPFTAC
jgi:hypothetical protein